MVEAAPPPAKFAEGTANIELLAADFAAIAAIMQHEARIHLPDTKKTLVHSRLVKQVRNLGFDSFESYIARVRQDPKERAFMVEALTTNHTHFFREAHHFDHFRTTVLPGLKERVKAGQPVRIWSAGCSSGEEVYTIAMCLLGPDRAEALWARQGNVKLLATDIAPSVVQAVRQAEYSAETVEPIPMSYRTVWMERRGDSYTIVPEMRSMVQANVLNLFGPWPMRHQYDVIFCRNVMIYFDDKAKADLISKFVNLLRPGGYLYIGHSERLMGDAAHLLQRSGQTCFVKPGPEQA